MRDRYHPACSDAERAPGCTSGVAGSARSGCDIINARALRTPKRGVMTFGRHKTLTLLQIAEVQDRRQQGWTISALYLSNADLEDEAP